MDGDFKGEGEGIAVLNPATGATLATVSEASPGQVDGAVKAAQKAFDAWSRTTPVERSNLLLKLASKIDDEAANLAKLESQNAGKPYARALGVFGEQGVIELVAIAGYYAMLAMILNVGRKALPVGQQPMLPWFPH